MGSDGHGRSLINYAFLGGTEPFVLNRIKNKRVMGSDGGSAVYNERVMGSDSAGQQNTGTRGTAENGSRARMFLKITDFDSGAWSKTIVGTCRKRSVSDTFRCFEGWGT